jgi:hypothetical protein
MPAESAGVRAPKDRRIASFDWARGGVLIYILVALGLLLRLCAGLVLSLRLLRASRATGETTEGVELRESDEVTVPLTLAMGNATILLPGDWRQWNGAKLAAVSVRISSVAIRWCSCSRQFIGSCYGSAR